MKLQAQILLLQRDVSSCLTTSSETSANSLMDIQNEDVGKRYYKIHINRLQFCQALLPLVIQVHISPHLAPPKANYNPHPTPPSPPPPQAYPATSASRAQQTLPKQKQITFPFSTGPIIRRASLPFSTNRLTPSALRNRMPEGARVQDSPSGSGVEAEAEAESNPGASSPL